MKPINDDRENAGGSKQNKQRKDAGSGQIVVEL